MNTVKLPNFLRPLKSKYLVRIGRENDGGYLIDNKSIEHSDFLLSYGIDHDWSFEKEFTDLAKCPLHSYDGSVGPSFFISKLKLRIINLIKKPNKRYINESKYWFLLPIRFYSFFNVFKKSSGINHYEKYVGNQENSISLKNTLVKIPKKYRNIFLKVDIEGSEYEILEEIINSQSRFSGLVIEFHEVNNNIDIIKNFIHRFSFKLVHLHINNYVEIEKDKLPDVIELSFSSFEMTTEFVSELPHSLDMENNKDGPIYNIVF